MSIKPGLVSLQGHNRLAKHDAKLINNTSLLNVSWQCEPSMMAVMMMMMVTMMMDLFLSITIIIGTLRSLCSCVYILVCMEMNICNT